MPRLRLIDLRLARNDLESSFEMDAVTETFVDYLPRDLFIIIFFKKKKS